MARGVTHPVIATVVLAKNDEDFSAMAALGTAVVGGVIGLFTTRPTG
jgi:hypothetical protein